jgi:broad-specificity NMP kinase
MKLVVIYGPPAVGKLTVAKELSKITGYRVLHNHLVIDLVESVFDRSHQKFWELIDSYRMDLVGMAAKENVQGVILTSVNIKGQDDRFIKNLVETVGKHQGDSHFVQLTCDRAKIRERLVEPSRKEHKKLTDTGLFDDFISKHEVFESIGFVDSLKIDNTDIAPDETARMIKEHYRL